MMVVRIVTVALLFVTGDTLSAQEVEPRDRSTVFGFTGSGFIGPYPNDGMLGLGGFIGLEQRLSTALTFRALASVQRGVSTADDIALCRPDGLGNGGCLPDPVLPHWLSTVEINAVIAPVPRIPLRFVAGLGVAIAGDARRTIRGARPTSSPTETPLVIRRGVEIRLGRSPRAPRLQYTHSDFRPQPVGLNRVEAVSLLFVR